MDCPADRQLTAFLDGQLAAQAVVTLELHVAHCEDCAMVVGHLGALNSPGPTVVGDRYRVEELVGRGGMGEVWAAFDPELERRVAIKLIRAQLGDVGSKRLVREARALARLQHANVLAVYDVGESDGEMFVVTELVDGETLAAWQTNRDDNELVAAYLQAAAGLAAAHRQGLVHRDIKPTNLFVGADGVVKVGDFGLAVAAGAPNVAGGDESDSRATQTGGIAGTPAYMAPEQRAGSEADARADQFSLAVSLAEALSGTRPTADPSTDELAGCGSLAPVLARSLSRVPGRRFADMDAWAEAITVAREGGGQPETKPWGRVLALGGVAVAVAATAALVIAGRGGGKTAATPERAAVASAVSSDASVRSEPPTPDATSPTVRVAAAASAADANTKQARRPTPSRPTAAPISKDKPPPTERRDLSQDRAPSPTAPTTNGSSALARADRALYRGDTQACLAAIAAAGPQTGKNHEKATVIRARCEMLAGDCKKGSARLRSLSQSDATISSAEDAFCRTDRGPIGTRVRRLHRQVLIFAMQRRFGCGHYQASALSAAGDPTLRKVPRGEASVKAVISHLAECYAKASQCGRAHSLLDHPRSRKLGVPSDISGCSR